MQLTCHHIQSPQFLIYKTKMTIISTSKGPREWHGVSKAQARGGSTGGHCAACLSLGSPGSVVVTALQPVTKSAHRALSGLCPGTAETGSGGVILLFDGNVNVNLYVILHFSLLH